MKRKKYKIKSNAKYIIIILLILFLCGGIYIIYLGSNQKNTNIETYSYKENTNVNYKVYLKKNNFYEEEYLEMDRQYPSNLTDYIEIEMEYAYNGSRLFETNYEYSIDATIIGEYVSSGSAKAEIWRKNYNIQPVTKEETEDTTTINLKKKVIIDYGKYNKAVNDYRNNFRLAIDAYLNVSLKIKYSINVNDSEIKQEETKNITLKIPLTSNTFKITSDYEKEKSNTLANTEVITKNYYIIALGYAIVLINIVFAYIFYIKFIKIYKTEYYQKIDKLLKDYSEIIVEVSTPLEYNDTVKIIDVKTFDDMVDIEEEIKSPILLYEIKKGEEAWFVIANNNHLYRYIIK